MNDYYDFFESCQWFHRAWILQEVTLTRDIVVLLGKLTISRDTLYEVACSLTSSGAQNRFSINDHNRSTEDPRPLGWQMMRLGRIRDICQEGGPEALSYKGLLTVMFDATTGKGDGLHILECCFPDFAASRLLILVIKCTRSWVCGQ